MSPFISPTRLSAHLAAGARDARDASRVRRRASSAYRKLAAVLGASAQLLLPACSDSEAPPRPEPDASVPYCEPGTEACACDEASACDDGLLCVAGRCLAPERGGDAPERPVRPRPPIRMPTARDAAADATPDGDAPLDAGGPGALDAAPEPEPPGGGDASPDAAAPDAA